MIPSGRLVRWAALPAAGLLGVLALAAAGLAAATPAVLAATGTAAADIPAGYLALYQQAAAGCPGLAWPVLAGIGKVETDHGRSASLISSAQALGPMQFLAGTWASYGVDADGDGRADPFHPADAVYAAAGYLCALGAGTDTSDALIAYNCGNTGPACRAASTGYAATVLAYAARYATPADGRPGPVAAVAIRAALAQVGTPYVWGGQSPGIGFDCSGLVAYAYAAAGIALPRVAGDQYAAGPRLPAGAPLAAGDLVFFGADPAHVHHVGLYLGGGRLVDAPHTGALVRVEPLAVFPDLLGATRPAAAGGLR